MAGVFYNYTSYSEKEFIALLALSHNMKTMVLFH